MWHVFRCRDYALQPWDTKGRRDLRWVGCQRKVGLDGDCVGWYTEGQRHLGLLVIPVFALITPISENRDPKGIIGNIGKYWKHEVLDILWVFGNMKLCPEQLPVFSEWIGNICYDLWQCFRFELGFQKSELPSKTTIGSQFPKHGPTGLTAMLSRCRSKLWVE